jgi:hypothetical protein
MAWTLGPTPGVGAECGSQVTPLGPPKGAGRGLLGWRTVLAVIPPMVGFVIFWFLSSRVSKAVGVFLAEQPVIVEHGRAGRASGLAPGLRSVTW